MKVSSRLGLHSGSLNHRELSPVQSSGPASGIGAEHSAPTVNKEWRLPHLGEHAQMLLKDQDEEGCLLISN